MTKNSPFGKNSDEEIIKRFMDTSPKRDRVYLFNPVDAKMMADKARNNGVYMNVKLVETKNGPKPWTRAIDMQSDNPLLKNEINISDVARRKEGERVILQGNLKEAKNIESEKIMSPDEFMRDHVYSEDYESGLSM